MKSLRPIAIACLSVLLTSGITIVCLAQSVPTPATAPVSPNASAPAVATTPAPAPVQVISHGNQIEVKVPDQVSLSTVMSSLCQQQKLKCTGTETLATYRGPAMAVDGTLRQVIAKLVEGTDINYEFSRSSEGGATAIAFLGHAPKGTAPAATAQQPAAPPPFKAMHSRPFPGNVPQEGGTPNQPAPQPQR
jgi:hypothetical protein